MILHNVVVVKKNFHERRKHMANKPFTQVDNGFIRQGGLTAYKKMTFIVLCSFKNKSGKCHPSVERLAAAVGCTGRTIIKAVKVLTALRLVRKTKMPGSNVNEYTILSDGEFLSHISEQASLPSETDSPALVNEVQQVSEPDSRKEEPYKNNHLENNHQSIYPAADSMDEMEKYRALIKFNISYDAMCAKYGADRMDEVVELMLDVVCGKRDTITIGGTEYSAEAVKGRFLKLHDGHIDYVFEALDKNTAGIRIYAVNAV